MSATEALSTFEQQQIVNKAALNQLERIIAVQGSTWQPRSQDDRLIAESQFKVPLAEVRPEMTSVLREQAIEEPPLSPAKAADKVSPLFCDNDSPEKYIKQGKKFGKNLAAFSL